MTFDLQSKSAQDSLNARATLALRVVVAVSLAAACVMALAQTGDEEVEAAMSPPAHFSEVDLGRLERIFWVCDHAAATYGVDGPTGMACASATEQLKQRMFAGDFEAMLAWWRDNKAAQHEALEQAERPAGEQHGEATAQVDDFPMP